MHAGGRGKAGGVKLAKTPEEAREVASRILGMQIKGLTVQKVLVTDAAEIASEAYVGIILDRASKKPVFMVSPAGGIDIEEVAAKTPEKILRLPIDHAVWPHAVPGHGARVLPLSGGREGTRGREDHEAALRRLHGERCLARRDQSAGRHA